MPNDQDIRAETAPDGLLRPYTAGRLSLPNRVAFTATINNLGRSRDITPEQIAFYEARARGGAGLIITEGLSVHPTSIPGFSVPLAFERGNIPGFARLAAAAHRHGTPILGQLWHIGRQALHMPLLKPWSASGTRDPYSGMTPHAMDEDEIHELIEGFASSAAHLAEAGFDGVEIHGAHGYVITQFLSPSSNVRDDRWGGSTENRTRFVLEILRAIRERCGESFAVGLKISAHEYMAGGLDLAESRRIVALLAGDARARPDYLAVSQANASPSLEYHVPDLHFEPVPFAHLAAGIRDVADGVPVMALAKVPDLATGQRLLDEGTADLVGMSRAWLADPNLVARHAAGRTPRPCTYCNVCWEFIHTTREIVCVYAPETGRESTYREAAPATVPRTVRIVGGGLAGLEAARAAAAGGHTVHLYERDDHLGGRIAWDATVSGREEMALAPRWLAGEITEAGVAVHLGTEVTPQVVDGWDRRDAVVLATGARPVVQEIPGVPETLSMAEAWARRKELAGPVVVVDETQEEPLYALATALGSDGHEVHLLTSGEMVARRVAFVSRIGVLRRLDEAGVRVHTGVVPVGVEDGTLRIAHVLSRRVRDLGPVATAVRGGPLEAPPPLDTGGRQTLVVGDASAPRGYVASTREGHDAGLAITELPLPG